MVNTCSAERRLAVAVVSHHRFSLSQRQNTVEEDDHPNTTAWCSPTAVTRLLPQNTNVNVGANRNGQPPPSEWLFDMAGEEERGVVRVKVKVRRCLWRQAANVSWFRYPVGFLCLLAVRCRFGRLSASCWLSQDEYDSLFLLVDRTLAHLKAEG